MDEGKKDARYEAKLDLLTRLIEHYEYNYDDKPFGDPAFDAATTPRDVAAVLLARLDLLDAAQQDRQDPHRKD